MAMSRRAKKRAVILVVGVAGLAIGVSALFVMRTLNRERRANAALVEGLDAFERRDYAAATDQLGRYITRNRDDVEMILKYVESRSARRCPTRHLQVAIDWARIAASAMPDDPRARSSADDSLRRAPDAHGVHGGRRPAAPDRSAEQGGDAGAGGGSRGEGRTRGVLRGGATVRGCAPRRLAGPRGDGRRDAASRGFAPGGAELHRRRRRAEARRHQRRAPAGASRPAGSSARTRGGCDDQGDHDARARRGDAVPRHRDARRARDALAGRCDARSRGGPARRQRTRCRDRPRVEGGARERRGVAGPKDDPGQEPGGRRRHARGVGGARARRDKHPGRRRARGSLSRSPRIAPDRCVGALGRAARRDQTA